MLLLVISEVFQVRSPTPVEVAYFWDETSRASEVCHSLSRRSICSQSRVIC